MAMNHTISVPTTAAEIPLHRYQAFAALPDESKFDFHVLLSTIAGCTIEEAKQVKAKDVERALNAIIKALSDTNAELIHHYTHNGVTYGLEPQLDEITFGTMTDVCTAFESPDTWHKALAILYRPMVRETNSMGGLYAIEPYKADSWGYKNRQDVFQQAPASLLIGVRAFFLNGSRALETFTQAFFSLPSSK